MRIGALPAGHGMRGGVYQYGLALLDALSMEAQATGLDERVLLYSPGTELPLERLQSDGWAPVALPAFRTRADRLLDPLRRVAGEGQARSAWRKLRNRTAPTSAFRGDLDTIRGDPRMTEFFAGLGVDLMIYPVPTTVSFEVGLPYVMAVHDLQHRLQPEFPEVSANGEWEWREYVYRHGTRHALLILADSETGKEDILDIYGSYGITEDRVKVLPLMPPPYLSSDVPGDDRERVRVTHSLPERYFFYPAQFWAHKNHIGIVEALGLLKAEGLEPHVAFAGSWSGSPRETAFRQVVERARVLGVEQQLHLLGYVPNGDMPALYAEAVALVMPTYFGPTNTPPVEAWTIGCPVLTSDIRGIREHVGDAAVLVDPRSPTAIGDGMRRLWEDDVLWAELVARGRRRLGAFSMDDYRNRVAEIVAEAKTRLKA